MPYSKSLTAGIIIFILIFPVLGAFPYKGADNTASFQLVIPSTLTPISYTDSISKAVGATYGESVRYKNYLASDAIRDEFNGYGGINGTLTNNGGPLYIGITDKHSFDIRLQEYGNEPLTNIDPLLELTSVSKFTTIPAQTTQEISLALDHNVSDLVIRILPAPQEPSNIDVNVHINVRNYVPLSQYLTRVIFMFQTDVRNFTISITSKITAGHVYEVYVGITPIKNFEERSSAYSGVQYRQEAKVKDALAHLGLASSSRSKIMSGTAFGNLKQMAKGYYVLRAVAYTSLSITLDITMNSTRPSVSIRVRIRILTVIIIALRRPFKIRKEIEYLLRK